MAGRMPACACERRLTVPPLGERLLESLEDHALSGPRCVGQLGQMRELGGHHFGDGGRAGGCESFGFEIPLD